MDESLIERVWSRAARCCEYCLMPQDFFPAPFQIDHIIARQHRGPTIPSNLALSCPGRNLAKAGRLAGNDDRGRKRRLFNPREYEPWLLGWHLHFRLDRASGVIVPRTRRGEATVSSLRMNDPVRVFARRLQILSGLIA